MAILMGITRRWLAARPRTVMARCHCGLGCPNRPTTWGYNRHMEWVPLAPGHGRKLGDGS
jgi:hypothetical protein